VKRRWQVLKEVSLRRRATGKVVIKKCVEFKESTEDYILVQQVSPVRLEADLYPKDRWEVVDRVLQALQAAPKADDFDLGPDDDEEDDIPAEALAEIEGKAPPKGKPKEQSPGDIKKELPGEYNVLAPHDEGVTVEEMQDRMVGLQAHVDSNFAIEEGKRKVARARHLRALRQRTETAGVGFE